MKQESGKGKEGRRPAMRRVTAVCKPNRNVPLLEKSAAKERSHRGLVMVVTGNGKGKTTSALGQALRAIGHGCRVCMIQFMKGRKYGECLAAESFLPGLVMHQCGLDSFVMREKPAAVDMEMAKEGMKIAGQAVLSGEWDMVILDEINVALDFKLVSLADVLELIEKKPRSLDLILTGRYAPQELIERADMVSEVQEIKHHYAAGIKDRAGIEY